MGVWAQALDLLHVCDAQRAHFSAFVLFNSCSFSPLKKYPVTGLGSYNFFCINFWSGLPFWFSGIEFSFILDILLPHLVIHHKLHVQE